MTCGCFPQLQIQVLEQMSSNFQSIIRPGTVAKSFYQETPEKKCEGTDEGKIFATFWKRKNHSQPPRKLRLGHLKFILIRKRPNMGPPFSTNNNNRLRRLGLILILTITICGATWEGGLAVVLWCICVFVSLCLFVFVSLCLCVFVSLQGNLRRRARGSVVSNALTVSASR